MPHREPPIPSTPTVSASGPTPPGLVLELAQLFALRTEHRRDDIHVFEELMGALYAGAVAAERRAAVALLADRPDLPPSIAVLMAFDEIGIAEPIVQRGRTLATIDRIRLVGNGSEDHRVAVASRDDLEEAVISALLLHGGGRTIEVLAANTMLRLTGAQTDRLVERVIEAGASVAAVTDRLDLGAARLIDIFFELDRPTRRRALLGFDAETAFRRIEKRGRRTPPAKLEMIESRLLDAAVAGDDETYAHLLASASGMDVELARRVIADPGGEPLVIALMAAGLDAADVTSILVRSNPAFGWTYPLIRDLVQLYDAIGWRMAEAVIERWSARSGRRLTTALRQLDDSGRPHGRKQPARKGDTRTEAARALGRQRE